MIQRKIKIDANRLKRETEKIRDKEWKGKIVEKLKLMNELSVAVQLTKVSIPSEQ